MALGGAKKSLTKQWWFWAAIAFAVVAVVLSVTLPLYVYAFDHFGKYDIDKVTALEFQEGSEDFKILQLTDTHIKSETQLDYAKRSFQELIDKSAEGDDHKPDLLVFTGDFVWGKHTKELLPKYLAMIDEFKIPYAFVYGNHDLEGNAEVKDFKKAFADSKYGIYQTGPKSVTGNSNYSINIKKDGKVVYSLMMLDSLRYAKMKGTDRGFNYIHDDQVRYYEWNIKGVSEATYGEFDPENGKVVPSFVFFHVPQLQFFDLRDKILKYYKENKLELGSETEWGVATLSDDAEYPGQRTTDEWLYPIKYTKLLDTASRLQSTKAMFFGHLHYNTGYYKYCNEENGYKMELVHGTKTLTTSLYNGCELEQVEDTKVGGTLISIKADGNYSYERLFSTIFAPEFKHNYKNV